MKLFYYIWINSQKFGTSTNWVNIYLFEIRENLEIRLLQGNKHPNSFMRSGWQTSRDGDIANNR
jgi:hypothetical protein